jgi:hypothetical protein
VENEQDAGALPLNGSFNPHDPENGQRVFNFGATFDEIEDFA